MKEGISLRGYFESQLSRIGGDFKGKFVLFDRMTEVNRRFLGDSLDDVVLSLKLLSNINFLFNSHSGGGQRADLRSGDIYASDHLGYLALLGTNYDKKYIFARMSLFDRGDIISFDDAEYLCQLSGLRSRGKLKRVGYVR